METLVSINNVCLYDPIVYISTYLMYRNNLIGVRIYFQSLDEEVIQQTPSYDFNTFLGNVLLLIKGILKYFHSQASDS